MEPPMIVRSLATCTLIGLTLLGGSRAARADVTLRSLAQEQGLHVGAMILDATWTNEDQRKVVREQFNAATVGTYWSRTRPDANTYEWSVTDSAVAWAVDNGLDIHLHPLVYPAADQNPGWLKMALQSNPASAAAILQDHISTAMHRYAAGTVNNPSSGIVWDVVNEAVGPNGQYRPSPWLTAMPAAPGKTVPEYIIQAFTMARAADPLATLLYNDHDIELTNGYQSGKWTLVKEIVQELSNLHLIDGVGWELHTTPDEVLGNQFALQDRMAWVKTLGLKNFVTELDMEIPASAGEAALARQGEAYQRVTEIWLGQNNGGWLQTWGVYDGQTWLGNKRPLMFDDQYQKKAAFNGVANALIAAVPETSSFIMLLGASTLAGALTLAARKRRST
jgi:endo-1,4-beta-xylanase